AMSLERGEHTLINLLDPGDPLDITVSRAYEIEGLSLSGHGVVIYEFAGANGVAPEAPPQTSLQLERSYPNPFSPPTTIRYSLPAESRVRIGVYDIAGREVAVIRNDVQVEGPHEERWDGADSSGLPVSAGMYFVRLDAGDETRTSKMMLVK
nr:T9SS type A sorting domain-containing protein [bacterium]